MEKASSFFRDDDPVYVAINLSGLFITDMDDVVRAKISSNIFTCLKIVQQYFKFYHWLEIPNISGLRAERSILKEWDFSRYLRLRICANLKWNFLLQLSEDIVLYTFSPFTQNLRYALPHGSFKWQFAEPPPEELRKSRTMMPAIFIHYTNQDSRETEKLRVFTREVSFKPGNISYQGVGTSLTFLCIIFGSAA